MTPEPHLTRRPDPDRAESWLIDCADIHCGSISRAVGLPGAAQRWAWFCGFYPGSNRGEQPHALPLALNDQAKAVMFDFVDPVRPGGDFSSRGSGKEQT